LTRIPLAIADSPPDKLNRVKGSVQRSSSVSSAPTRDGRDRDGVSVKLEDAAAAAAAAGAAAAAADPPPAKGPLTDRLAHFVIGAEVVFKHNKNKQGVEGEGIQCIIKSITGDGPKKRCVFCSAMYLQFAIRISRFSSSASSSYSFFSCSFFPCSFSLLRLNIL
jgi:SAGA-associated factor 29